MRYIYRIYCPDLPDSIYIGSTDNMRFRTNVHKYNSKTKQTKLYTTIRENGGWDNWN